MLVITRGYIPSITITNNYWWQSLGIINYYPLLTLTVIIHYSINHTIPPMFTQKTPRFPRQVALASIRFARLFSWWPRSIHCWGTVYQTSHRDWMMMSWYFNGASMEFQWHKKWGFNGISWSFNGTEWGLTEFEWDLRIIQKWEIHWQAMFDDRRVSNQGMRFKGNIMDI